MHTLEKKRTRKKIIGVSGITIAFSPSILNKQHTHRTQDDPGIASFLTTVHVTGLKGSHKVANLLNIKVNESRL